MSEIDCIFEDKEDCPLKDLHIFCTDCAENNYIEVIKKAVSDYEKLGPAFTEVFTSFNKLIKNEGEIVELVLPVDSIFIINRVVTALLGTDETLAYSKEQILYRRLLFYFLSVLIDEFESSEYGEKVIN